jgi:2',3'-cyclic-nucleotide 2'-phosphodiesterase (5'-nucleotidase family)
MNSSIKSTLHLLILAMFSVMAFSAITQSPVAYADEVNIVIIHVNDFHGYLLPYEDSSLAQPPQKIGGAAFIATKIKELQARNPGATLLVDAGDIAQGTPLSNELRGIPVIEYMNSMKFQATTLGNHEFDWGLENLKKRIKLEKFPVLCANLVVEKTGKTMEFVKPYQIFEIKGLKIGIIGVTTPTTPRISYPENVKGLKFLEPEGVVTKYRDILKARGVSVIGVLSHLGIDDDHLLATRVSGLSFIIGGHSHTVIKNPHVENGTIIVQTGAYGMYLGALALSIDSNSGKILSFTQKNELIPIIDRDIKPDAAIAAMIDRHNASIKPIMDEVLGQAKADIGKIPPPGRGDSPLGSAVTDLLRSETGTDVFFYNAGGLRSPFQKGRITRGDVYRVLPFDDYMVTMELSGKDMRDILLKGVNREKIIQLSGVTLVYCPGKTGYECIKDIRVLGMPLDLKKYYRVGTINYLYGGGDGYDSFKNARKAMTGKLYTRDILSRAIKARGAISIPSGSRIVISGKKEEKR